MFPNSVNSPKYIFQFFPKELSPTHPGQTSRTNDLGNPKGLFRAFGPKGEGK